MSEPARPADRYTHGHHESVLRVHRWRTAGNSAAYLLPHLDPGLRLLDVGCGPGSVTADFAALLAPGAVVGVDAVPAVVEAARVEHTAGNLAFEVGDAYALAFPDDSFDVVHAHQVLQHLTDPVAALREMRRVVAPTGVVAVRDSDYGAFAWSPADPWLDRWNDLYREVARGNGAEPDAGRHLHRWAREAGFAAITATSSTWTFHTPEDRAWWGGAWAERAVASDFARYARDLGLANDAELTRIGEAWQRWADGPDGLLVVVHGEVLARG